MTALRVLLGLLLTCGAAADTLFDQLGPNGLTQIQLIFAVVPAEMTAVAREALEGPGPVTMFGITNEVLSEMQGGLEMSDILTLASSILEFHIVPGVRSRHHQSTMWRAAIWVARRTPNGGENYGYHQQRCH
jgi:hypothetical protein